jgi:hypothetical protein
MANERPIAAVGERHGHEAAHGAANQAAIPFNGAVNPTGEVVPQMELPTNTVGGLPMMHMSLPTQLQRQHTQPQEATRRGALPTSRRQ